MHCSNWSNPYYSPGLSYHPFYQYPFDPTQEVFSYYPLASLPPGGYNFREQKQSPFPPINVEQLDKSARKFQHLMSQANLLIGKIVESKSFARELMTAAQLSNEKKVLELIRSTGITIDVRTDFTPDGIRIYLDNKDRPGECCDLLIALKW